MTLPKDWPARVKTSILQVISLAHLAIIHSRSWAANSVNARVRLQAELEQARNEISLLQEELRIKDARMAHLDAHRRPHYRPTERLGILELKAVRDWSAAQAARKFLVEPAILGGGLRPPNAGGRVLRPIRAWFT